VNAGGGEKESGSEMDESREGERRERQRLLKAQLLW
jgi:hypothetical protein